MPLVNTLIRVSTKCVFRTSHWVAVLRNALREKNVRHGGISRNGQTVELRARDAQTMEAIKGVIADQFADLQAVETPEGTEYKIVASLKPEAARRVQEQAIKQNITTLHNRINELGVAEPVIQQQGADRIVVQLPGVQDTAKAKDILGRTATLEVRLVDEGSEARAAETGTGPVPFGSERYLDREGIPVIVKKQVILTGENLTDAQPGFDGQTQEPTVNLSLDAKGARIFRDVTRENINKRMAILLFEKGKGEVVTAPVIRSEIGGGRVQISGRMSTVEANDTALLLRAGSLAAPMEIIEERTIGPSLGAENIAKGFDSVTWGFVAVTAFKTREPRTEMQPRALRHMPIAQVLCHARRQRALQGPLGRFDDIYLAPESACHGRQFETDKARTHYGDALRMPDSFAQGLRVGQGSQPEQALERGAGHIGPAHARPGGQHQVVVGECLAIAQAHAMCGAIDGLDAHGRQHLQAQALIEGRGPQKQPFDGDGALEECLGQRRALVGQAGLIAHHRDGSFMPGFAQRGRELEAALPGADDDGAVGHQTCRSGMCTISWSTPGASASWQPNRLCSRRSPAALASISSSTSLMGGRKPIEAGSTYTWQVAHMAEPPHSATMPGMPWPTAVIMSVAPGLAGTASREPSGCT